MVIFSGGVLPHNCAAGDLPKHPQRCAPGQPIAQHRRGLRRMLMTRMARFHHDGRRTISSPNGPLVRSRREREKQSNRTRARTKNRDRTSRMQIAHNNRGKTKPKARPPFALRETPTRPSKIDQKRSQIPTRSKIRSILSYQRSLVRIQIGSQCTGSNMPAKKIAICGLLVFTNQLKSGIL